MRRYLLPLLAAVVAAAATAGLSFAGEDRRDRGEDPRANRAYDIGLWGDLPYSGVQRESGIPNLIEDLNETELAFTAHVGDIKAGGERCDDPIYTQFRGYLESLQAPAAYTPGDNEWTDCDRANNGPYSSAERLRHIREVFFSTPFTFGRRRLRQEVQAAPYVENRRWHVGRVTYATLHVVGSDNNRSGDVAPDPVEWAARDQATNAWMRETFAAAERRGSVAVMLLAQANPGFDRHDPNRAPVRDPQTLLPEDGFTNFLRTLREETIAFRRPVTLVHGDSHYFRVDKPLLDAQGRRLENFTRLETQGDNAQNGNNDVHWTRVQVDPRDDEVFSYEPEVVEGNRVAVP